eukprot:CAMPEP_0178844034 /NCGR_PEP_ID=MMETSP0746-20121128/16534_1 /TAXON_ID=913974 /ORGANISM="Nitzschia punctata, Strain CCMP561" /LENGTH=126 /DNA_ID=CAMNT_0020507827 /DNA_START=111 /DNA_END=488 /DNA_ORIENTATION=-
MGKSLQTTLQRHADLRHDCTDPSAPICNCNVSDATEPQKGLNLRSSLKQHCQDANVEDDNSQIIRKELVMIGAGPHALTLMLRLVEPDADLLDEKERHMRADFHTRMRPSVQVRRHVKDIQKGSVH